MATRSRARSALGSFVFLLAAPGIVAGVVSWLFIGWEVRDPLSGWSVFRVVGALLIAVGAHTPESAMHAQL